MCAGRISGHAAALTSPQLQLVTSGILGDETTRHDSTRASAESVDDGGPSMQHSSTTTNASRTAPSPAARPSVRQTSRQQTIINEWQRRLCHSSALPWARSCRRRNCCFPHSLQYSGGGHPAPIPVGVFPRSQLLFLILLVEVCSRTETSSAKVVLHRSAITVVSVPLIT